MIGLIIMNHSEHLKTAVLGNQPLIHEPSGVNSSNAYDLVLWL